MSATDIAAPHMMVVDDHDSLAAALVAALANLSVVDKARRANLGTYSYEYADIADVIRLTRPVLAVHGLVALTPVHEHGDGLAVTVTLLHRSGERLDLGPFPFPHGRDAQATGSMVTYHRRYALVAALGMAAGDDDDGAAAAPRQPEQTEPTADEALLVGLRNTIDALDDDAKARLREVWKSAGLPSPKGALTVSQYDTALGLLDGLETAPGAAESAGNGPAAPVEPDELRKTVLADVANREPDYVAGWCDAKGVDLNASEWDADTTLAWFSEHIEAEF